MTVVQDSPNTSGRVLRHVLLPAIAPAAIIGLYFTPVTLIGCANRGLLALVVALFAAIAAIVTVAIAIRCGARHDAASTWWILSTAILMLALALLLALG
jgi:hypothetical protein